MIDTDMIELEDCPDCRGMGAIHYEGDWCVYVECMDCGAHTTFIEYANDAEKAEAVRAVVSTWNRGKVIHMAPGE